MDGSDASIRGAGPVIRWLVAVLVIVSAMAVNLRGARGVGRSAEIGAALVFGAFLLLVAAWLVHGPGPGTAIAVVVHDLGADHKDALLLGLSILILNYSGWDSVSTFASEVDRPRRNYPLALGGALILSVLAYTLPVIAGITVTADPAVWSAEAGWPAIAGLIGGGWLGLVLAGAGLVSTSGLFDAQLLYVSRIPYVMARDGWLPQSLAKAQSETAAPRAAIVGFCAIIALLAMFSFGNLVVMMCLLYTATLTLEFLALVVFRVRRPDAERPFRVPGGTWGLMFVCLAPVIVAALVLGAAMRDGDSYAMQLGIVAGVAAAGIALYAIRCRHALALRAADKPATDVMVRRSRSV